MPSKIIVVAITINYRVLAYYFLNLKCSGPVFDNYCYDKDFIVTWRQSIRKKEVKVKIAVATFN